MVIKFKTSGPFFGYKLPISGPLLDYHLHNFNFFKSLKRMSVMIIFEKIILDFIEISTCIEDGYNEIKYFKTLDEEEFKLKAKEKNE